MKKSEIYVYSFNDSSNEVTQTCEMDLSIRYWDVIDNQINVRYCGSTSLTHGRHQDILNNFIDITKNLNSEHL